MSPNKVSKRIVAERLDWIEKMVKEINDLPLMDYTSFTAERRNVWAAESCLRRSLEAFMDLGRHVAAKGFGRGITEYEEIASVLKDGGVFDDEACLLFKTLAGYRNRMVHFYNEISDEELFEICTCQLADIPETAVVIRNWIHRNQEILDERL
jgi:uncharacterized protein YutE (UPF0331/DUF86 family)